MDEVTAEVNTLTRVRNHLKRNWKTYTVGVVAVSAIALQQANRRAFYAFLTEEGIDPMKFYCPEFYEELNP